MREFNGRAKVRKHAFFTAHVCTAFAITITALLYISRAWNSVPPASSWVSLTASPQSHVQAPWQPPAAPAAPAQHDERTVEPRSRGQERDDDNIHVASPSGLLRSDLRLQNGQLEYSIRSQRGLVISASVLRISETCMFGTPTMTPQWRVVDVSRSTTSTSWSNPFGELAVVPDRYNEVCVALARIGGRNGDDHGSNKAIAELELRVRAYDEGAAFRFVILNNSNNNGSGAIASWQDACCERVDFNVPHHKHAYWTPWAQANYTRMPLANWTGPAEPPLTIELDNGQWISIMEAGQTNFAHMRLDLVGDGQMRSRLMQGRASTLSVPRFPYELPWRLVMVAKSPGELLEHNYMMLNLNPASVLTDTSWIKPGRVLRLMNFHKEHAPIERQIAFAVEQNLAYVHLDAGWYGNEYDPRSDASKWNASRLDLPYLIKHAKSKGLGVILYVNHLALEQQLDDLFPLYRSWGVDGVKFGFVHVGPQNWTVWLHDAVKKAAEHRLIVDIHDDYRPTGFSRTYPNLLQVEGILGDEGFPSANQSTIYPFTRFLAGPADHTYCFLDRRLKKTKAHQLALPIVNFGPLQYMFWYDSPDAYDATRKSEVEFWRDMPTVWDETKVVDALPGEYVAIARRRGSIWWLGVVTNERGRNVTLDLAFLRQTATNTHFYEARLHQDADPATILQSSIAVTNNITLELKPNGGVAVRFGLVDT